MIQIEIFSPSPLLSAAADIVSKLNSKGDGLDSFTWVRFLEMYSLYIGCSESAKVENTDTGVLVSKKESIFSDLFPSKFKKSFQISWKQ